MRLLPCRHLLAGAAHVKLILLMRDPIERAKTQEPVPYTLPESSPNPLPFPSTRFTDHLLASRHTPRAPDFERTWN